MAGATVAAQLITVVVSPLLTRLYQPSDFGTYTVYASLAALLASVMSLRFETAMFVSSIDEEAIAVVHLSMLVIVVAAAASLLVAVALPASVPARLGLGTSRELLALVSLGALLTAALRVASLWSLRVSEFRRLSISRLTQSLTSAAVQIGMSVPLASGGLIAGLLASNAVGVTSLARSQGVWRASMKFPLILRMMREHRRFALLSTPSGLLNAIVLYVPALVIAAIFGPAVAGMFALAHRLLALPLNTIGQALSEAFLTGFSEMKRADDVVGMKRLFLNALAGISIVSILLVGSLALVGPALFGRVFGQNWEQAGVYLRLLTPMYMLGLIASPFGGVLELLNRQDLFLMREVVRAVVLTGSLLVCGTFGLSEVATFATLGLSGAATFGFAVAVAWSTLSTYAPTGQPIAGGD